MSFGNKKLDNGYDSWITKTSEDYFRKEDLDLFIIKRVKYGKESTKKEDREYYSDDILNDIKTNGYVGNIKDWINISKSMNFEGLIIIELGNNFKTIKFDKNEEDNEDNSDEDDYEEDLKHE